MPPLTTRCSANRSSGPSGRCAPGFPPASHPARAPSLVPLPALWMRLGVPPGLPFPSTYALSSLASIFTPTLWTPTPPRSQARHLKMVPGGPLGRSNYEDNGDRDSGMASQRLEQRDYGFGTRARPLGSHVTLSGLRPKTMGWWRQVFLGVSQG